MLKCLKKCKKTETTVILAKKPFFSQLKLKFLNFPFNFLRKITKMLSKSKKIKKKTPTEPFSLCSAFKKYDFDELAIFHPPLSPYVSFSPQGVSIIDWKDPQALKELTKAILLYKFHLKFWDIPSNFLCPTVPSRVSYVEWIHGLLAEKNGGKPLKNQEKKPKIEKNPKIQEEFQSANPENKGNCIKGLDIGTGASLIYPILGYKMFGWHFVATEKNREALKSASKIQKNNGFQAFIEIREAKTGIFKGVINKNEDFFDFSMCNPPFFESLDEQKSVSWRTCEIKEFEGEFEGGELEFMKKSFEESLGFKRNVGVFTSLVGRKKDFEQFLGFLDRRKTEEKFEIDSKTLYIGKNARWVVGWRFQ